MAGYTYKIAAPETLSVPAGAVRALLREGDGDAALLYLYLLSGSGDFETARAAAALRMPAARTEAAAGTLERLGLLERTAPVKAPEQPSRPERADELPEYTAGDVLRELENGSSFRQLLDEVQSILGKMLSQDDLMRLFGIYDALGLPPEVIVQLVTWCARESRRKFGPGRRPTMRQIEKTAYIWEKEGIFSLEQAEAYIRRQSEKHTQEDEFALALRITGRALTATESAYVDEWLRAGFGPDAADIAYDRTVTNAGKLDWKYMNGIFRSWHAKGLHTAAQIASGDTKSAPRAGARPAGPGAQAAPAAATAEELDRLKRLLEQINNG